MMASFSELVDGNFKGDVILMPEAMRALKAATEREGGSYVDVINAAILTYDAITFAASKGGDIGVKLSEAFGRVG